MLLGTGAAGLRAQLPGVKRQPYIVRFDEDKPNPFYRWVCYTFAWNAALSYALLNLAALSIASVTGSWYMKQICRYAYGPLSITILLLGAAGRLPRVGLSTRGEGAERRSSYGTVWATLVEKDVDPYRPVCQPVEGSIALAKTTLLRILELAAVSHMRESCRAWNAPSMIGYEGSSQSSAYISVASKIARVFYYRLTSQSVPEVSMKMYHATAFAITAVYLSFASMAQSPAQRAHEAADFKEIESYNLTMDIVTRTFQTLYEMKQEIKADPALQDQEKKNDADDQPKSLDQVGAIIAGSPKLTAIVSTHGFTPRSLAVAEMSVMQTAMAVMAANAGATESDLVGKASVNLANLKLLREHKAELDALSKKYPISND